MSNQEEPNRPVGTGENKLIEELQPRHQSDDQDESTHLHGTAEIRRIKEFQSGVQKIETSLVPVDKLANIIANLSLDSLPEARLILAHPAWTGLDDQSAIVRLPRSVHGWDMVCVLQRTDDVRMSISLPYDDLPSSSPNPRFARMRLDCSIYYDPARDDCLLYNSTGCEIYLTKLENDMRRTSIPSSGAVIVSPGMWRISVGAAVESVEIHLLDFLVLRRQFTVAICEAGEYRQVPAPSNKRKAVDINAYAGQATRLRRDADATQIVVAPVTDDRAAKTSIAVAATSSSVARSSGRASLLDLVDGDTAVVCGTAQSSEHSDGRLASYQLRRLQKIVEKGSTSIFTAQHSSLDGDVVAKVMKYEGKAETLMQCAKDWEREKMTLEKLSHPNIIALQRFDGRLFALFVEVLPKSLYRGTICNLDVADSLTILRNMSSALAYLENEKIVHNDIKPLNIAYSQQRGAVLLDFGLASKSNDKAHNGGTPWYIPPEFRTFQTRGAAGDIWALAVTMLYILKGISFPDRIGCGWQISEVTIRKSEAATKMVDWLEKVASARDRLDRNNAVQGQVYRMLNTDPALRPQALDIASIFSKPA